MLFKGIDTILKKNLQIKRDESFLILYDTSYSKLARTFAERAAGVTNKISRCKIPVGKVNGEEPPANAIIALKSADTAVFLVSKSLSHTKARREATKNGTRIGSMPSISEAIIKRSIDIDYKELKDNTKKLAKQMDKATKVKITTKKGTDLEFSIKGRKGHGLSAGIFNKKGKWGNLPEGEAFVAPVEGSANGTLVIDGSIAGFGLTKKTTFNIEHGSVTKITGTHAAKLTKMLNKVGKDSRNIAELGIGLNKKAIITGIVLEDEKAYGTCHIAIGNNIGFGGKVNVPLHIDSVIKKPTITFDDKFIMTNGILKI